MAQTKGGIPVLNKSSDVAADLSSNQFYAAKLNASEQIALGAVQGEKVIGILQNTPTANEHGSVMCLGLSKVKLGGAVTVMDPLCTDANGKLVKADENDEFVIAIALQTGVANDLIQAFVCPIGAMTQLEGTEVLLAAADYSSTGQYTAMKVNSAGKFVKCAAAGERAAGILQNAPASGANAEVIMYGRATFIAGTGGVSAGDLLACEADGELVTATGDAHVLGWALEDVVAGATGLMWVDTSGINTVDGAPLASAKIWVGSAGGVAAAVTLAGLLTLTNAGVAGLPNFADEATSGTLPLLYTVLVDSATAGDFDVVLDRKVRVIDVWAQHTGGAGEASDTIQVKNGANAITDAMDWSGADNAIVRAGTIDDAQAAIAAAGTLRVTTVDNDAGTDVGLGTVYVLAIPVA